MKRGIDFPGLKFIALVLGTKKCANREGLVGKKLIGLFKLPRNPSSEMDAVNRIYLSLLLGVVRQRMRLTYSAWSSQH